MPRTQTNVGRAGFIADHTSVERLNGGRQIDWAGVGAGYIDAGSGKKVLKAGTVMGELLGAGKLRPRVVTTNPATCVLETNAIEDEPSAAASGHGVMVGGVVFQNLMPDATGGPPKVLPAAMKTELAAAGCTFKYETYEDSRAS